jgi:hypothetical protein
MKTLTSNFCIIIALLLLTSCTGAYYTNAPQQNLPQLDPNKQSVLIKIVNKSGSNIEFYKGSLKGLILAPRESYIARLSYGYQKHSWSYVALYKNRIKHYTSAIIVTHKSKTLAIYPPREDDMFHTSGRGILDLKDY